MAWVRNKSDRRIVTFHGRKFYRGQWVEVTNIRMLAEANTSPELWEVVEKMPEVVKAARAKADKSQELLNTRIRCVFREKELFEKGKKREFFVFPHKSYQKKVCIPRHCRLRGCPLNPEYDPEQERPISPWTKKETKPSTTPAPIPPTETKPKEEAPSPPSLIDKAADGAKKVVEKITGTYFCTNCGRNHKRDSQIGNDHIEYEKKD